VSKRREFVPFVPTPALINALWKGVDRGDGDACWIWRGSTNSLGYGTLSAIRGRRGSGRDMILAHRLSYAITHGPLQRGALVLHRCDTPACVRPEHLFSGTQRDNMRDCMAKGRRRALVEGGTCKHGHALVGSNVAKRWGGGIECRECRRSYGRAHYARTKAPQPGEPGRNEG
jgi:hypothetical protein